jgi:O-antigen/teichoic acid export membrane protein
LGDRWAALAAIFPLVASAFLAGTLFHLCSSTLYVLGWNRDVAAFHATSAVLLAAVASVLVPGMGAAGFGWSDVVSSVSFAVIYWFCRRRIGAPGLEVAGLWTAAFALTILGGMYWWLVPAGVAILALPRSRRALKGTWTAVFVRG